MPLSLPNLDDRKYDDLVTEGRAMIPTLAPEWTNHNPSDPGITLIELFAYLTEMLIYRVNQVTDANYLAFLKLLKGSDWTPPTENLTAEKLATLIRETVLELRKPNRAITCEDFERLALESDSRVARARCVPRRNLEAENSSAPAIEKPGHISVVIVPFDQANNSQPSAELLDSVEKYLEPHRLLTTQVHVVGPRYFHFGVQLTLVLKPDAIAEEYLNFALGLECQSHLDDGTFSDDLKKAFQDHNISFPSNGKITVRKANTEWLISDNLTDQYYLVRNESGNLNVYKDTMRVSVIKALKQFFDPLMGGEDGKGWLFGRNIFVSDVYKLLDTQPGVDYVTKTNDPRNPQKQLDLFNADISRLLRNTQEDLVAVEIQSDELIDVQKMTFDLVIQ
jgi:hypothetical protein